MTYENLLFLYDRVTQPSGARNSHDRPMIVSSECVLLIGWLQLDKGICEFSTAILNSNKH